MPEVRAQQFNGDEFDTYVELVTVEKAREYLETNFTLNRAIDPKQVKEYGKAMKDGTFTLGTDFIGFDENGNLVNGQHRLTALIESEVPCWFGIISGLPTENAQNLDKGKRRDRADRLTLAGKPISKSAVSIVQTVMCNYSSSTAPSSQFREVIADDKIWNAYKKHKNIIDFYVNNELSRPTEICAAAIKLYVYMSSKWDPDDSNLARFPHGQDPHERALHFYNLAKHGFSKLRDTSSVFDGPAIEFNQRRNSVDYQLQVTRSKDKYRWAVSYAWKFLTGVNKAKLDRPFDEDMFGDFARDFEATT